MNSAARAPHSAQWKKSGISSRLSAASSKSGEVLLDGQQLEQGVELHELQAGLGEDSARGTFVKALSIMPLVRASR